MLTNDKQETQILTAKRVGRRRILQGAGALGAAGALTALAGSGIGEAAQAPSNSIVGTWLENITTPGNVLPPFQTLASYVPGGIFILTAAIDSTPATASGPTHGAWVQTGGRSFSWFGHAFSYDPQLNPNGTYNIREHVTLSEKGDSYTGSGSFEIVFNGVVTFSGTSTVVAKRVTV